MTVFAALPHFVMLADAPPLAVFACVLLGFSMRAELAWPAVLAFGLGLVVLAAAFPFFRWCGIVIAVEEKIDHIAFLSGNHSNPSAREDCFMYIYAFRLFLAI